MIPGQCLEEIKLFFVSKEYKQLAFSEVLKIFVIWLFFITQPTFDSL
jgi:hypothetical protein